MPYVYIYISYGIYGMIWWDMVAPGIYIYINISIYAMIWCVYIYIYDNLAYIYIDIWYTQHFKHILMIYLCDLGKW